MRRLFGDFGRDYKLRLRCACRLQLRLIRLLSAASERDSRGKKGSESEYVPHDPAASGAGIRDSRPRDAIAEIVSENFGLLYDAAGHVNGAGEHFLHLERRDHRL